MLCEPRNEIETRLVERGAHTQYSHIQTTVFRDALGALSRARIRTCLLRDDPEAYENVGELDLLVPLDQLASAVDVLACLGWEPLDTSKFYPHKVPLVIFDGQNFRKLDIHGSIIAGGMIYMDSSWYWSTATEHTSGVRIPSPDMWLLHCCLHVVLAKRQLPAKYVERIRRVHLSKAQIEELLRRAGSFGLRNVMAEVLEDPVGTLSNSRRVAWLRSRAKASLFMFHPSNIFRSLARLLYTVVACLAGLRRGVLIAVIGPDGAGKTTFIEALERQIRSLELSTRSAYMGPWDRPLLPSSWVLARLGASPLDDLSALPSVRLHRRIADRIDPSGWIRRNLYYLNLPAEMWARYLWRVLRHQLAWRNVIADRYIYDLRVGFRNIIVCNSPKLRRWLCSLLPKPDATILLDNEAAVIFARKQEYPIEMIEGALRTYRTVAEEYGILSVRSDRSPDELAAAFMAQNWREIVRRRRDLRLWRKWEPKAWSYV